MTLHLSDGEVARIMSPADYLTAMEQAFAALARGEIASLPPLHAPVDGGGFHAKAALWTGDPPLFALKLNGNFPGNPAIGLPTIQGVVVLSRADDGRVLAVMDSAEITLRRTAAATALAARHLAVPGASTVTICGCGEQGEAQLRALAAVLPLRRAFAWDVDGGRAEGFAARCADLGLDVAAAGDLAECAPASHVIVTATTARVAYLGPQHVSPGTFVAGVGADSPDKTELTPALMAAARVVTDVTAQCVVMGDLAHAIAAGAMGEADVHAELGDVVLGRSPGRTDPTQVFVFDSTGTAAQDITAAAEVWRRATS